MTHKKFKVFRLKNIETLSPEVSAFLENPGFRLKSLSLTEVHSWNETLISFGYDDDFSFATPTYAIKTVRVGPNTLSNEELEKKLELIVAELDGIICQDITYTNNELIATFLVYKSM